eukprot:8480551-Prorocentrum_lima.AAC.1
MTSSLVGSEMCIRDRANSVAMVDPDEPRVVAQRILVGATDRQGTLLVTRGLVCEDLHNAGREVAVDV